LLVINKHHIATPDQFLDPEFCRTTSGFLNFLGTLLLLDQNSDTPDHLRAIAHKANTLADHGLDEWLRWLYCLIDFGTLYEPKRVLINSLDPEQFFYSYPD